MNPARPGLIIVGCGARKAATARPACDLYTGPYFRACYATARALAPGRVLILSARHGLLSPSQTVAPYDLTIGQPGAITAGQLADQARARHLLAYPVTALCSARYAALLRSVWADVAAPLTGLGIGRQRHALAVLRDQADALAALVAECLECGCAPDLPLLCPACPNPACPCGLAVARAAGGAR